MLKEVGTPVVAACRPSPRAMCGARFASFVYSCACSCVAGRPDHRVKAFVRPGRYTSNKHQKESFEIVFHNPCCASRYHTRVRLYFRTRSQRAKGKTCMNGWLSEERRPSLKASWARSPSQSYTFITLLSPRPAETSSADIFCPSSTHDLRTLLFEESISATRSTTERPPHTFYSNLSRRTGTYLPSRQPQHRLSTAAT